MIISKGAIWSKVWFHGIKASYRVNLFDDKEATLGFTEWQTHLACGKADLGCKNKVRFEESFQVVPAIASRVKVLRIAQTTMLTTGKPFSKEEQEKITEGVFMVLKLLSSTLSPL